ncbi:MAG TPA: S41 family peptidase [Candidatus Saccharimonadales bacterium]|nr:S41 family peptidase [Candidatus Saccharimonadales bacterium]
MDESTPNPRLSKNALRRLFLGVAIVLAFGASFFGGAAYEKSRQQLDLSKFWDVYSLVKSNYVGDINKTDVVNGAIEGMVAGLGDPFSSYLTQDQSQNLNSELSGQFEGIGAELTDKNGQVVVVAPITDSPAEKAGLKANDVIVAVDGKSTDGQTLDQVVNEIRGTKGTTVKVTVTRGSQDAPIDLTITRDSIQVKSVTWKMIGSVGYIDISQFGDDTVNLATQAVNELNAKNPKAMVIDLRNNPGGYLNDVSPIAGMFISPSVVVKEKYRAGMTDSISSTAIPVMPNTPMYLLVNGGSASAAEILAGALQDYGRAKLVGAKTFGKGSVQNVIDLSDGSALRITIAEWLTPKDRAINKVGLTPDIAVTGDKDITTGADPVLDKALQLANQN